MGTDRPSEATDIADTGTQQTAKGNKVKTRTRDKNVLATKRRCVSTACIACRRRKSKCDGNTPSCAACASVYGTECVYDPNSDHRRKGVYKKDIDNLKTRNSTLQTLVQGILNYPESEVMELVNQIRTCESLDDVAELILARSVGLDEEADGTGEDSEADDHATPKFETELAGKMGGLRLDNGNMQFLGGTSNLLFTDLDASHENGTATTPGIEQYSSKEDIIRSWTKVTDDAELIMHLLNMYFTWHYTYFTTLSKHMFLQDFWRGRPTNGQKKNYCTSLLINAMLALGCHFTSWPGSRENPRNPATAGDHFFKEAKRLIVENDEYEQARLATVQALALMSVREAGCGREAKGWVYSGMSFRMASDLGLNVDTKNSVLDEQQIDARRITFWGCFLFDKCWSNYLGRTPQLPMTNISVPKFDVFPTEDAEPWSPWNDDGIDSSHSQPSRTRAVALQISALCEISNDILLNFYRPTQTSKPLGKQAEIKRLSDFHTRLESWRRDLPKELEPKEGQLPNVLVMQYSHANSPLPPQVSPRKICTQAAAMISKLLRLYKRTYGLRQICNIVVYIVHSACTIHLMNLPEKDARRDIARGFKQLEEIAEGWLCAGRTLVILAIQVKKWGINLPEEASAVLSRAEAKYTVTSPPPSSKGENSGNRSPAPQQTGRISERMSQTASPKSNNGTSLVATNVGIVGRHQNHAAGDSPRSLQPSTPSPRALQALANHQSQGESPTAMFGAPENLFEDSKEWWFKDQATIFDNWSRRDSFPSAFPAGSAGVTNGALPGTMNHLSGNEMAMFGMNDGNDMTGSNGLSRLSDVTLPEDMNASYPTMGQNTTKGNGVSDLSYLDFGSGNPYGYNDGDAY